MQCVHCYMSVPHGSGALKGVIVPISHLSVPCLVLLVSQIVANPPHYSIFGNFELDF